ncbi:cupin domain-containing protein [Microbulbifer magnicolonia]|uniref:cupin domain-containing protein n=1 Tax=Microbulbifer magnicolonia TaxID=3109744 RepID=UPI002B410A14|nr:cupin domain-containing protein [Microbulbifer sp. GG15]
MAANKWYLTALLAMTASFNPHAEEMKSEDGYIVNIDERTVSNSNFREVLFTGSRSQLVVMSLKPGEEIGEEVHTGIDQFIRFEEGEAKVILNGKEHRVKADDAVVIPAGVRHNVINTSATRDLKLYTVYSPPEHKDGTLHKTKAEAMAEHHD